jgi:hypothetical protein
VFAINTSGIMLTRGKFEKKEQVAYVTIGLRIKQARPIQHRSAFNTRSRYHEKPGRLYATIISTELKKKKAYEFD